jgi:hypothetical protein
MKSISIRSLPRDLASGCRVTLCAVQEHPTLGVSAVGCAVRPIAKVDDFQALINDGRPWQDADHISLDLGVLLRGRAGNKRRTVAATSMNERSSRSHSILTIRFTQNPK